MKTKTPLYHDPDTRAAEFSAGRLRANEAADTGYFAAFIREGRRDGSALAERSGFEPSTLHFAHASLSRTPSFLRREARPRKIKCREVVAVNVKDRPDRSQVALLRLAVGRETSHVCVYPEKGAGTDEMLVNGPRGPLGANRESQ